LESITRFREDVILRTALDETLDLFGDNSKKILLYTICIDRNNYNDERTAVRDQEGYLDYERIAKVMKRIFGENGSKLVLEHLDKKIAAIKKVKTFSEPNSA